MTVSLLYSTFIFTETSLDDLKATVLKKLGLAWNSSIAFSQLRGSKRIDLEDGQSPFPRRLILVAKYSTDDDFEAFRSYAFLNGNVEVIVSHAQSKQVGVAFGELLDIFLTVCNVQGLAKGGYIFPYRRIQGE